MFFDVAQVTALFKDNIQMVFSHHTRMHLQSEGTFRPKDLIEFTASYSWKQIIENCKCPVRIIDPNNTKTFL